MLVSRCFPTRIPGTLGFIGTPPRVLCKFWEIILYNKKKFAVVTVHIIMSRLASHIIHYNWWHTVFLNAIYFGKFVLEWLYYSPICIGIQLILSSNLVLFVLACITCITIASSSKPGPSLIMHQNGRIWVVLLLWADLYNWPTQKIILFQFVSKLVKTQWSLYSVWMLWIGTVTS